MFVPGSWGSGVGQKGHLNKTGGEKVKKSFGAVCAGGPTQKSGEGGGTHKRKR